ncbi:hypothetical protein CA951_15325 [Rhodococcus sp. NCIMB 12038]|nr:hypothetical protein CA951_15325 [Rhodococcus sp. NCIMB 12038]
MPKDGGTHFGTHLGRKYRRYSSGDVVPIEDARIRLDERRMSALRDFSPTRCLGEFTRAFGALRSVPTRCRDPAFTFAVPHDVFEEGGTREIG